MKKDLNYYLGLPYKIEVTPIPEGEGGGYMARLPQFGRLGIVGDGDNIEEAIADLSVNKELRFKRYLEEGLVIPEPEKEREEFSGRFVIRMPKFLHGELSSQAQTNGVSLNQYVTTLLSMNFQTDKLAVSINTVEKKVKSLSEHIGALKYTIESASGSIHRDINSYLAGGYSRAA
ncbi:MAG: type II toxin-antitoxin system HicB family antitoxin [Deltaproteobacteria bacterium]|nr:type II toxin-antitoxin system HicB family antitoxin [Deltaproteobacteria bacterium]